MFSVWRVADWTGKPFSIPSYQLVIGSNVGSTYVIRTCLRATYAIPPDKWEEYLCISAVRMTFSF